MTNKEIKQIIRQLKSHEMSIRDVPEEVRHDKDIVAAERKFGLRKEFNRGFDVIHNFFFVEEKIFCKGLMGELIGQDNRLTFDTFEEYYEYLDGDIYESSCYKYCDFDKYRDFIKKKKIDITRLLEGETFLTETVDDVSLDISQEELDAYDKAEGNKKLIKTWIKKFEGCTSGYDLETVVEKYDKSKMKDILDVSFFFYYYIFKDVDDKNRFNAIMEYMCTGKAPEYKIINALCSIYNPNDVIENYDYLGGTKQTNYKHKKKLKDYVKLLNAEKIKFKTRCYFDDKSHYYCEETEGFEDGRRWASVSYQRYFETFEEFIKYKKGNLNGVDLSGAIKLDVDFSLYEMDETTKLPLVAIDDLSCEISKEYQNGKFVVWKEWKTKEGNSVKKNTFVTRYFFDFVYYLKGNLSDSFLVFCDGLENLKDFETIDFSGARVTSKLCEKFGIPYESYNLNKDAIGSFAIAEKNEEETSLAFAENENTVIEVDNRNRHSLSLLGEDDRNCQRVYYITDIHLMHRLQNANCKSKDDVRYVLQKVVDNIVNETGSLLLIGGDVSSDFSVFELFVKLLKWKLSRKRSGKTEVVFVLGNHELWGFPKKSIDEIITIYRNVIEKNGMHLLQNELLYKDSDDRICKISYEELLSISTNELRTQIQSTRIVILGGLGFSGYNEEFNANQGIYRATLDRAGEIAASKKFEELYNKVLPSINDKNTIIFTHTPKRDWNANAEPYKNFVYVSGHTHRNEFHDDGDYRIYSDNQIGYRNENPHLKNFLIDNEYDFFSDYEDGIHEITGAQYNDFYRGKNIQMTFTREVNVLYMLKKNGYYCFIHKAKSGTLTILNGGALKRLEEKDINYYYDHMDEVISYIGKPLDKYMSIQQSISEEIRKLGGTGTIHGCIIDIDWYNHIFVNPVDLKITGYWALNMVDKIVYPDVPALLEAKCPVFYDNYLKLIKGDEKNPLISVKNKKGELEVLPQEYLSTDIYKASREIKKMQKLTSNILSSWYKNSVQVNALSGE